MTNSPHKQQTTYTDRALKIGLTKMLPDKLEYSGRLYWRMDTNPEMDNYVVKDTELLDLCWRVEEGLSPEQSREYKRFLGSEVVKADKDIYWLDNIGSIQTYSIHATWQQRVIALARTLGVEIV